MALVIKDPLANTGDIRNLHSVPGSAKSLVGVLGNPLQYSFLENPMDREALWATIHSIAKTQTKLK